MAIFNNHTVSSQAKYENATARPRTNWLLSNRLYVGETIHKGKAYPGQHDAIVSRGLFEAVQTKLADKAAVPAGSSTRGTVSLLAGMIRDARGRPMSPYHTKNHGRRYSYYASNLNDDASAPAQRLPAGELEAGVRGAVVRWLRDGERIRSLARGLDAPGIEALFTNCRAQASMLESTPLVAARAQLRQLGLQVDVDLRDIRATFDSSILLTMAGLSTAEGSPVTLSIPTTQTNYGHEPRLRLEPTDARTTPRDERLVELLARAFAARDELQAMSEPDLAAVPLTRLRHLQRLARLSWLDPVIVRAVLSGSQPRHISARALWRSAEFPLCWHQQRELLRI